MLEGIQQAIAGMEFLEVEEYTICNWVEGDRVEFCGEIDKIGSTSVQVRLDTGSFIKCFPEDLKPPKAAEEAPPQPETMPPMPRKLDALPGDRVTFEGEILEMKDGWAKLNCGGRSALVSQDQIREHPEPKAPKSCSLNQIVRLADLLHDSDLEQLHNAIAALREARLDEALEEVLDEAPTDSTETSRDRQQHGWVEIKEINGKRYRYLRWRDGKKQRSKYLGRLKS